MDESVESVFLSPCLQISVIKSVVIDGTSSFIVFSVDRKHVLSKKMSDMYCSVRLGLEYQSSPQNPNLSIGNVLNAAELMAGA